MTRTAVLLSGGVDSSVALRLLVEEERSGLVACYIKIWLEDELAHLGVCPWEEDLRFAREVSETARVPLEVISLQREYHDRVVAYTLEELRRGRTPSPDIFCNERIKFGAFLDAMDPTIQRVATGHYARIETAPGSRGEGGAVRLLRGVDPVKDQTYFLSHLTQRQLRRALFPVGGLEKSAVRRLAREFALPNRDRPDSQGICFLGKVPFDEFVRFHLGERPGDILEAGTGKKLGEHAGFWFYTIGQRKGLGLTGGPWFVVRKDIERNTVHVAHAERLEENARGAFQVTDARWILEEPRDGRLEVKLRHSPRLQGATIAKEAGGGYTVRLDQKDPGIASGQFTVFYEGNTCLGGARII
ncbi:MAG TPA: tRNA 2-thiouridine(34) synthase MnmA [Planctomycetota bacterium]|nr:tRNA 2-thiouridine(34) synthase MnmA [Planctomycetota bacterium]